MQAPESDSRCIWDEYAAAFNELSDELVTAGIDPNLLRKVVELRAEYEQKRIMS